MKLRRERRKKCEWMNGELLSLIHKRKFLYRKLKSDDFTDSNLFQLYKRTRNVSNNLYRKLKNEFYQRYCVECSKCPSRLWRVIRDVPGGGSARHNLTISVSELNSHFAFLVSSGCGDVPLLVPEGPDEDNAFRNFSPVTVHFVKALLLKLDVSKCGGPDNICPAILKDPTTSALLS